MRDVSRISAQLQRPGIEPAQVRSTVQASLRSSRASVRRAAGRYWPGQCESYRRNHATCCTYHVLRSEINVDRPARGRLSLPRESSCAKPPPRGMWRGYTACRRSQSGARLRGRNQTDTPAVRFGSLPSSERLSEHACANAKAAGPLDELRGDTNAILRKRKPRSLVARRSVLMWFGAENRYRRS